ncbi:MAG: hypothetical protein KME16_20905 [Scytolyngbya sp. HA4215-MV1]|jgi:hypothetical protein|nr:hypothetical protein [Scytolyngbya sp. HA4215-MV1]
MDLMRNRLYRLIDRLPEDERTKLWKRLEAVYQDDYLLKAIQSSKQSLQPGDTLTREGALEFLAFLS